MPAVPCITLPESPLMAAVRFSESHDLAVPGSPIRSKERSVRSVAIAISTKRLCPMYLGVMFTPQAVPPVTNLSTALGESCHPMGFSSFLSSSLRASNSLA